MRHLHLAVLALAALCACRPHDTNLPPLGLPDGCQPLLAGADCMLPWPSDYFRTDDAEMPSGARLALTEAARQKTKQGVNVDVAQTRHIDGASPQPTLVALLGPVAPQGFVRLEDGGAPSLSAGSSNTLLVEADSGAPVPHFVDLDPRALEPARQAIVLHPFVRLKPGARYVALIHGARTPDGAEAPAPEGFRRLRDGLTRGDPQLEPLQQFYDDVVFPAAQRAGVARGELQLAWPFTVGTSAWAERDLLAVRSLTLAWLGAHAPVVTIDSVVEESAGRADIFRVVKGHLRGPLFLEKPEPFAKLARDAAGAVAQNGEVDFPFTAVIPSGVAAKTGPAGVFLYGHGFFGSVSEVEDSSSVAIANALGRTVLGTEWWGMHASDIGKVGDALTGQPGQAMQFIDRVHQAMANFLVLEAAAPSLGALPAFSREGAPLVAGPADVFVGISQGHILGGTYSALSPTVRRVVLHVGGAGLSGLMMRSTAFGAYFSLLGLSMSDPLEQQKYVATLQRPLDRIDPATWADALLASPLPQSPQRQVLMQAGLDDDAVPNLGTFFHARALGLKVLEPSPASPWGLERATGPLPSALALYDFNLGDPADFYRVADFSPTQTPVHEGVRRLAAAKAQMAEFVIDGVVTNHCDGVCDPQ